MPQFLWPSFSGGILGPQSIGRVDVQGYARAAKDIVNFVVDLRGGLIKRPGTWNVPIQSSQRNLGVVSDYYDPNLAAYRLKLIPFIFSVYETRIILFANNGTTRNFYVFKFNYADRDTSPAGKSAIPYCIASGEHEYNNPQVIKYAQINDVLYLASPERPFSKMIRRGSTSSKPYTESPGVPPAQSQAEVYNILPVSLGLSLMYHPSKQKHAKYHIDIGGPHEIPIRWPIIRNTPDYENAIGDPGTGAGTRTSKGYSNIKPSIGSLGEWDGEAFGTNRVPASIANAGAALGLSDSSNADWYSLCYVVEPDWTSLGTTIAGGTLSIVEGETTHRLAIVGSKNWVYELNNGTDNGQFVFTIIVVKKNSTDEKLPNTKQDNWRIDGATFVGDDPDMNNPKAVAVHEQRLWVAGPSGDPSSIWASAVRDYENFVYEIADEEELKDSDPLKFTLAANNQDPIYWLQPSNGKLFAGTSETVYILQGSDQTGITPTSIKVTSDSRIGTRNMQPAVVGDAIIAPYRTGQQLQILGYRFETDSFQSINMNLLCGEITRPGIRAMAWQQEPYQCLWCVLRDGTLATYTMDTSTAEGGTRAWARHTTTAGNFIDVCSIPYVGKYSYDCMFFLVDRGAPGTTGDGDICLEYMPLDRGFWGFGVVDACRSSTTSEEGYIEVRNGVPLDYPTRDSQFTYDPPGMHVPPPYLRDWVMKETQIGADESFIESGFPIFAKLETLPSEVYDPSHAFLGLKKKRAGTVIVRVLNTWDLKLNGDNIFSRLVFQYGYERAKVLDGLLRWNNFGWSHEGTLRIIHDEAFPCHILTVGYRLDMGGDD
jgi:hypothetical protein